jgi:hypothetical protein
MYIVLHPPAGVWIKKVMIGRYFLSNSVLGTAFRGWYILLGKGDPADRNVTLRSMLKNCLAVIREGELKLNGDTHLIEFLFYSVHDFCGVVTFFNFRFVSKYYNVEVGGDNVLFNVELFVVRGDG